KDDVRARLPCPRDEGLTVAGDDDDAHARSAHREHLTDQDVAGDVGQAQVAQDHVEMTNATELDGLTPQSHRDHVGALSAQQNTEDLSDVRSVLDDQDAQTAQCHTIPCAPRHKKQGECQRAHLYWHSVTSALQFSFTARALDSLDEAVFLTDEQFRVLVWNDAMERRTGLARGAVLGLPAPAILDVLGGDGEARLATWRTDEGVIGGVTVSLKAESSPRRDDRFLRVIETIGKSLSGASNVSDVLDTVVSTAMQVMRADSAMVVGWDGRAPDLDILRIVGRLGASYAPGGTLPV